MPAYFAIPGGPPQPAAREHQLDPCPKQGTSRLSPRSLPGHQEPHVGYCVFNSWDMLNREVPAQLPLLRMQKVLGRAYPTARRPTSNLSYYGAS